MLLEFFAPLEAPKNETDSERSTREYLRAAIQRLVDEFMNNFDSVDNLLEPLSFGVDQGPSSQQRKKTFWKFGAFIISDVHMHKACSYIIIIYTILSCVMCRKVNDECRFGNDPSRTPHTEPMLFEWFGTACAFNDIGTFTA